MSTSPDVGTTVTLDWSLGDRLRKIRRHAGLTQSKFAAELGVGEPAYGSWETDRVTPPNVVSIAKRIEMLTGVSAVWTLGLDDNSPRPGGPGTEAVVGECAVRDLNPEPADSGTDDDGGAGLAPVVRPDFGTPLPAVAALLDLVAA